MTKNKWIAGAVGVAVIIAAIIWFGRGRKDETYETNQQPAPQAATSTAPVATSTPSTTPPVVKGKSSAYTTALETYKYRIQFSQCHGVDNIVGNGILAIRQGDRFMLDNRDPVAHTFAFKGYSAKIAGYGYAIATASVLGQYPITCDGGGAATLNVQK